MAPIPMPSLSPSTLDPNDFFAWYMSKYILKSHARHLERSFLIISWLQRTGPRDSGIETFKIHSIANNSTINHNEKLKLSELILYIFKCRITEFQFSVLVCCCKIVNRIVFSSTFSNYYQWTISLFVSYQTQRNLGNVERI